MLLPIFWTCWCLASIVTARDPAGFEDGSDLESFVTRPELRAPRYIVSRHHPKDRIAEGYWFVAHYPSLFDAQPSWRKEHVPCQTGPHIYDNDGQLVWSGACEYNNRNVFDFKAVVVNGEHHLTFFVSGNNREVDEIPADRVKEAGVMMDNQYQEVARVHQVGFKLLDVHEFTVLPDGKSALISTTYPKDVNATEIGQAERSILVYGFQEVDMKTGELIFDWDPLQHGIMLNESCDATGMKGDDGWWDYFHLNSADKFANGDYLVSGRHTSTIYRISKDDGHVIWRLGGNISDFTMDENVPFYWQHHVQIRAESTSEIVISVFDNAGEDLDRNLQLPQSRSVGKIITLNTDIMSATILRQFPRPDGQRTSKLGSLQTIGSDINTANVFIDWAQRGFISEYDQDNTLIMEATLQSSRMSTYRAYKYPFVGNPLDLPVLKVLPIAYDEEIASTFYVSWNGATEVAQWVFYGSVDDENTTYEKLATVKKNGFETSWVTPGTFSYAYVEALDKNGHVLNTSTTVKVDTVDQARYQVVYPQAAAVEEKSAAQSTDQTSLPFIPGTLPALILDSFALFGAYSLVRSLIPEFLKRRKGHRVVAHDRQTSGG
ncbi:uncharacterized protein MYCFIDRAFT_137029 [Pseudocercospora fijiensis CIRAD86]|uniref:ASST-domain-containing protein n=1 Tax=Pseudocercospora fijiensis (strain CIRAD86) TaxID=383855 RepID=M3B1I7_PSEFD|nr:uncharacterized protein MYCFIDRAFT_137029 [Pseudocercospora fijiensis CIRAD86]EME83218.1 hypothetical protein MYCFIDRAFT_137029 [Pseudocercospora fijiensis CIRAD86]